MKPVIYHKIAGKEYICIFGTSFPLDELSTIKWEKCVTVIRETHGVRERLYYYGDEAEELRAFFLEQNEV